MCVLCVCLLLLSSLALATFLGDDFFPSLYLGGLVRLFAWGPVNKPVLPLYVFLLLTYLDSMYFPGPSCGVQNVERIKSFPSSPAVGVRYVGRIKSSSSTCAEGVQFVGRIKSSISVRAKGVQKVGRIKSPSSMRTVSCASGIPMTVPTSVGVSGGCFFAGTPSPPLCIFVANKKHAAEGGGWMSGVVSQLPLFLLSPAVLPGVAGAALPLGVPCITFGGPSSTFQYHRSDPPGCRLRGGGSMAEQLLADLAPRTIVPSYKPSHAEARGRQSATEARMAAKRAETLREATVVAAHPYRYLSSHQTDQFAFCYNSWLTAARKFHIFEEDFAEQLSMRSPCRRARFLDHVKERCGAATCLIFLLNHHVVGQLHWSFAVLHLDLQLIEHYDSYSPSESVGGVCYSLDSSLTEVEDAVPDSTQSERVRENRRRSVIPSPPNRVQWWIEPLLQVGAFLRPAGTDTDGLVRVCKPGAYFRQQDGSSCGIFTLLGIILVTRGAVWQSESEAVFPDGSLFPSEFLEASRLRGAGKQLLCLSRLANNVKEVFVSLADDVETSRPPGPPLSHGARGLASGGAGREVLARASQGASVVPFLAPAAVRASICLAPRPARVALPAPRCKAGPSAGGRMVPGILTLKAIWAKSPPGAPASSPMRKALPAMLLRQAVGERVPGDVGSSPSDYVETSGEVRRTCVPVRGGRLHFLDAPMLAEPANGAFEKGSSVGAFEDSRHEFLPLVTTALHFLDALILAEPANGTFEKGFSVGTFEDGRHEFLPLVSCEISGDRSTCTFEDGSRVKLPLASGEGLLPPPDVKHWLSCGRRFLAAAPPAGRADLELWTREDGLRLSRRAVYFESLRRGRPPDQWINMHGPGGPSHPSVQRKGGPTVFREVQGLGGSSLVASPLVCPPAPAARAKHRRRKSAIPLRTRLLATTSIAPARAIAPKPVSPPPTGASSPPGVESVPAHASFHLTTPSVWPKAHIISKRNWQRIWAAIELLRPGSLLDGDVYPPPLVQQALQPLYANWVVAPSTVCPGKGLFSLRSYRKGELVGLYGGVAGGAHITPNAYSMGLGSSGINIDGTPDTRFPWTWAGFLNDDRTKRYTNCRVWKDGTITATCPIGAHMELFIDYGELYDWREVDCLRFRSVITFASQCLVPQGGERWELILDEIKGSADLILSAVWPLDTLHLSPAGSLSREAFTLWYSCTQGLENHPRLIHHQPPRLLPEDSLCSWLERFCSYEPIASRLGWKGDWSGEFALVSSLIHSPVPPASLRAHLQRAGRSLQSWEEAVTGWRSHPLWASLADGAASSPGSATSGGSSPPSPPNAQGPPVRRLVADGWSGKVRWEASTDEDSAPPSPIPGGSRDRVGSPGGVRSTPPSSPPYGSELGSEEAQSPVSSDPPSPRVVVAPCVPLGGMTSSAEGCPPYVLPPERLDPAASPVSKLNWSAFEDEERFILLRPSLNTSGPSGRGWE